MSRSPEPSIQQIRVAFLITALGGLLFTFDLPLLRLSMAEQWTMVFTRGIFLFYAITLGWAFSRAARGDRTPYLAGMAGLAVAFTSTIGNMSYIGAVVHTDAANVVFIIALTPVIAAAMSRMILRETVHAYTWIATIAAFIGAGIIASEGLRTGNWVGDGLALVSAFCSATIFTIIRATGKKVATSLALGSLSSALFALLFFQVSPMALMAPGAFGVQAWLWLALNGLVTIPLATVLLARGPRVLPSADVSMFFMLETVLTPIWIWVLFAEVPSARVLLGGAIVVLTLLCHSWWRLARTVRAAHALQPGA
ncbi:DMT family transporter [Aestuariivirga sp.]|uniref:DMT family transporter n=1 Tax=Aestuariivirga sp. TaxID=2650926 RepID=UPI00391BAEDE